MKSPGRAMIYYLVYNSVFLFFKLTSQHPYAEVFVGEPHVVTLDIKNLSLVEETIKRILNTEVSANMSATVS